MATTEWPQEVKQAALRIFLEHGSSVASRQTGVPSGTIRYWANTDDPGAKAERVAMQRAARAEATEAERKEAERIEAEMLAASQVRQKLKRAELHELLLERAVELLHRMDDEHIDYRGKDARQVTFPKPGAADIKHYATAAAILLDKWRLENGESTDRREYVGDSPIDREVARLVGEVQRRAETAAAGGTVAAPPTE